MERPGSGCGRRLSDEVAGWRSWAAWLGAFAVLGVLTWSTPTLAQSCQATSCHPEPNAALCARLGKRCGPVTAVDNCGVTRTVSCGVCMGGEVCDTAVSVCTECTSDINFCNGKCHCQVDNCGAPVWCGYCPREPCSEGMEHVCCDGTCVANANDCRIDCSYRPHCFDQD